MAKRPCGGERAASIFVIQGARSSAQAIGDTWSVDAVLHMPGEGERHGVGASETVIKAGSGRDRGHVFLSESTIAPDFAGPPLHVHDREDECFYILDGALSIRCGRGAVGTTAGSFVSLPRAARTGSGRRARRSGCC